MLGWAKDQNNVERLTIGSMAKLSLATNASRDKELLDMLKGSMNGESKDTRGAAGGDRRRRDLRVRARAQGRDGGHRPAEGQGPGLGAQHVSGGERPARPRWRSAASSPAPWARSRSASPAWSAARVSGAALKYITPHSGALSFPWSIARPVPARMPRGWCKHNTNVQD